MVILLETEILQYPLTSPPTEYFDVDFTSYLFFIHQTIESWSDVTTPQIDDGSGSTGYAWQ